MAAIICLCLCLSLSALGLFVCLFLYFSYMRSSLALFIFHLFLCFSLCHLPSISHAACIYMMQGGADIAVTDENKQGYVQLLVAQKLSGAIKAQIKGFTTGT